MEAWRQKLLDIKPRLPVFDGNGKPTPNPVVVSIPGTFAFKRRGIQDFDSVLQVFDWTLVDVPVVIDLSGCQTANFQALALVVVYVWKLKANGCHVQFRLKEDGSAATRMWKLMGGNEAISVLLHAHRRFYVDRFKPMIAIRTTGDFKSTIQTIEKFTEPFNVEYMNTLRQVLSELLYNNMEHGSSWFNYCGTDLQLPGMCQFSWYETNNEIHFIVADVGMGIKNHLTLTYAGIADDAEALRMAIRAKVSGTFARSDPYQAKDNAGMGLYISTNIVRRLGAEMHLVSGSAVMHISANDISVRELEHAWPGTFAIVSVRLEKNALFVLHNMMQDFREAAEAEQRTADGEESDSRHYLHMRNYFGPNAEVKDEAVSYRNKFLVEAANFGKRIVLDFDGVKSSPHSFLSALIATPIKIMGINAYKRIKIINATAEIRETLDFILDENTDSGPLI